MELNKVFQVKVSDDQMYAYLHLKEPTHWNTNDFSNDISLKEEFIRFLHNQHVCYGIQAAVIESVIEHFNDIDFPLLIAEGDAPIKGEDGALDFKVEHSVRMDLNQHDKIDFKNVMKIPTVEPGQLIAIIQDPTTGNPGKNVFGEIIEASIGSSVNIVAGENTTKVEEDQSIYASNFGQVSLINNVLKVLPLYEVSNTLSLSSGNIDFNGSVLIRGDVPEGFDVKAKGDITIEGLVEGANVTAGGSIYIKDGISAVGKGFVKAGVDITTNHINQGYVQAGRHIKAEKSILHSTVVAGESISCQNGHIVGGTISSGSLVVCHDMGNRMHTLTQVFLGEKKSNREQRLNVDDQIKELESEVFKLKSLGEALIQKENLTTKEELTLQKQKQLISEKRLKLYELNLKRQQLNKENQQSEFMKLLIHGMLYPNTEIIVGKYSKRIKSGYKQVSVLFEENDFNIESIQ